MVCRHRKTGVHYAMKSVAKVDVITLKRVDGLARGDTDRPRPSACGLWALEGCAPCSHSCVECQRQPPGSMCLCVCTPPVCAGKAVMSAACKCPFIVTLHKVPVHASPAAFIPLALLCAAFGYSAIWWTVRDPECTRMQTFQDPQHLHAVMDFIPGGEVTPVSACACFGFVLVPSLKTHCPHLCMLVLLLLLVLLARILVGGTPTSPQLYHHLHTAGKFPTAAARFYAAEVLLAVEHLHSLGAAHRCLALENILLDSQADPLGPPVLSWQSTAAMHASPGPCEAGSFLVS